MPNPKAKTDHLPKYKSKWKHTPTKLIRVPEIYAEVVLRYARELDSGEIKPLKRIELLSEGKKIAVYAPYDPSGRFQETAKEIEGYRFQSDDKSWQWPIDCIIEVVEAFPDYWEDPKIPFAIAKVEQEKAEAARIAEAEKIAEEKAKIAKAKAKALEIVQLIEKAKVDDPLPCGWSLFNHQKEAVKWLLTHIRDSVYDGGILADHMGLGKSLSALVAAKAMRSFYDCPIFVVCPASLKDNWIREAGRAEVQIEVFSWAKVPKPLDTTKYLLIADEAHYAQNIRSQRTKKLLELAKHENCLATWLLTGTPIKNGQPINLYPLLYAVNHPLAPDEKGWDFQIHYCNARHEYFGDKRVWDNSGAAHLDELSKKTEDVILRRTKDECLDLPPKIRTLKVADLTAKENKTYKGEIKQLVQDYRERVKLGEVNESAEALVTLNIMRKVGSKYKVNSAIAVAQELLEQGQPVVIFTEFVDSAKAVYTALKGELLTGDTPVAERQQIVDRFQNGESKIFTGTIKAGGVGLTLTAASNVILLDRPWTPGEAEQAEDRCHRISAKNTVNSLWIQLGKIDEAIDELIKSKAKRIELILKGKRKTLRGIDKPAELAKELLSIL